MGSRLSAVAVAVAAALSLAATLPATAAEPPGRLLFEWIGAEDGSVGDTARALAAGPPGVLYVGTHDGLRRYDGERFVRVPAPHGTVEHVVTALLYDEPTQTLYVSTGAAAWRVRDGGTAELLRAGGSEDIHSQWARGPDGTFWLADQVGIWKLAPDADTFERLDDGPWRGVAVEADGTLWTCSIDGVFRGGPGGERVIDHPARRLLALPDGRGVAAGTDHGLYVVQGPAVRGLAPQRLVVTDLALVDGRLVGPTNLGVLLADPTDTSSELRRSQAGGILVRVAADDEGQLWFGELGRGLARVAEPSVRVWNPAKWAEQPGRTLILTQRKVGDRLLVAGMDRGWWVTPDLGISDATVAPGWNVDSVPLPDGGWVLVDNDARTWLRAPDGAMRAVIDPGRQSDRLLLLPDGSVLAPDVRGLWRAHPAPVALTPFPDEGGAGIALSDASSDGALYAIATTNVLRWTGDGFEVATEAPPGCEPANGALRNGDTLTAVCTSGLWVRAGDGPWSEPFEDVGGNEVQALARAGDELWAATGTDLLRVAPDPARFGRGHGLPPGPYRKFKLTALGDWLVQARTEDVVFVHRDALARARRTPTARILRREKIVGDRTVEVTSDADLVPGDSFLRLHLAEDSLRPADAITWRFQLDDGPWSEPQREPLLNLPGVQPGLHTVRASVRAAGTAWSEPAAWTFRLPPRWYERRDVQLGFALALVLVLSGFLVERARRLRSELDSLRERDEFRQVFGRFVAPEVAAEVLGGSLKAEGEERELTVLFADLANFTPLTESLPPRELVALLNRWLTAMVEEIEGTGGVVNKFMGDAVVAIFGAPRPHPDHAARAVRAALAMARRTRELGAELSAGVGVNTGRAIAGPIGAESRMEYTVIGEVVNIAARVEKLTRALSADVLVTDATMASMGSEDVAEELADAGEHALKGVGERVRVWRWDLSD